MELSIFRELLAALNQRQAVVADRDFYVRDPEGHLTALKATSANVWRIEKELPAGTDPVLRHYLERQSYLKAQAWLAENHPSMECGDTTPL